MRAAARQQPGGRSSIRRGAHPLHYAADGSLENPGWDAERQVAMIRLLLQAGACVDAPDKNGATPLHRAVRNRCSAAVDALLRAGADPHRTNDSGSTAFDLARWTTGRPGTGSAAAKAEQAVIATLLADHAT